MGGKVDAHGVGITSGLEKRTGMNQGGSVGTKAFGVGSGNNPKVMGPDGQMREGHNIVLAALSNKLSSLPSSNPALSSPAIIPPPIRPGAPPAIPTGAAN